MRPITLTGGVSGHLNDALALLAHLPGVEGSDPHRHLDGSSSHLAGGACRLAGLKVCVAATSHSWKLHRQMIV